MYQFYKQGEENNAKYEKCLKPIIIIKNSFVY